jgi:hypothetical protein
MGTFSKVRKIFKKFRSSKNFQKIEKRTQEAGKILNNRKTDQNLGNFQNGVFLFLRDKLCSIWPPCVKKSLGKTIYNTGIIVQKLILLFNIIFIKKIC